MSANTVFISYRRGVSVYLACAIYRDLLANGYLPEDVFWDTTRIDSGRMDDMLLHQIGARTHFVVILTAAAVERWQEVSDWLRLEIEYALEHERNIIPVLVRDFVFEGVECPGGTAQLRNYAAVRIFHEHLDETLPTLRERLQAPLTRDIPVLSVSESEQESYVTQKMRDAQKFPTPTHKQLRAEAHCDRALTHRFMGDLDEAINNYNKALQLYPEYVNAYSWRGNVHRLKGEIVRALEDYSKALRLDPTHVLTYNSRAILYTKMKYYEKAIGDYTQAIQLYPHFEKPYNNRGELLFMLGRYDEALADFQHAEKLKPGYSFALAGMAIVYHVMGNTDEAKRLWNSLIDGNKRFRSIEWVERNLQWHEPLVEEARKLINKL